MCESGNVKKIVSFFGEPSDIFDELNQRAEKHSAEKGMKYKWAPQIPYDQSKVIELLQESDAGIIDIEPYGDEVFSKTHDNTKLLVRFGVGYDKVDLEAASKYGIAVARTTGANTLGVAEMALALILSARRKFNINQQCVATGKWAKNVANETIQSTVGIIGFGPIGQAFANLIKGFDSRIIAYDPYVSREVIAEKGVEFTELEDLFKMSDAISIHVPYTSETHMMVNEKMLSLMKPNGVIVNTARGNIIDEKALYDALSSGKIGGAGLDVFASEPLSLDSPLHELDNIVLTPHVSSQTVESLWRIYEMAIDIAADFFKGQDSPHILNPEYKKNIK